MTVLDETHEVCVFCCASAFLASWNSVSVFTMRPAFSACHSTIMLYVKGVRRYNPHPLVKGMDET